MTRPYTPCALSSVRSRRRGAEEAVDRALSSAPMQLLRVALGKLDLEIERSPILHKHLSGSFLRLMFPVSGGAIEDGAVVSIVCLYDLDAGRTLYAHPMHAGPGTNPMLKSINGPMADPKAQPGRDGNRATLRILEHKRALWNRFGRERATLGQSEAGRRWRDGYYWSLKRLYFCNRCAQCKWGSPFFDGPDPSAPRKANVFAAAESGESLPARSCGVVAQVLNDGAWKTELAYARRGGFDVRTSPRLLKRLPGGHAQVFFPTNASVLQEGTPVAVAVIYQCSSQGALFAYHLSAGPDIEVQILHGERALGLPRPQPGTAGEAAKTTYRSWRREAWFQFWIGELEHGIEHASAEWLRGFWSALEALFGGNDLRTEREDGAAQLRKVEDN